MAIYVGQVFATPTSRKWPYRQAAHLFADTVEELHTFAENIGLKRQWFQDHPRLPHYDVTARNARTALMFGAIEVSRNEEVKFYKDRGTK